MTTIKKPRAKRTTKKLTTTPTKTQLTTTPAKTQLTADKACKNYSGTYGAAWRKQHGLD